MALGTAMKPTLSLGLRQQLKMTPQLQQAIRLLQLSALDLKREIQEALESNPMLEEDAEGESEVEAAGEFRQERDDEASGAADALEFGGPEQTPQGTGEVPGFGDIGDAALEEPAVDAELARPIPQDLPVDSNWDDVFQPPAAPAGAADAWRDIDDTNSAEQTLQDHLRWQLNLTPMTEADCLIGTAIIDAINPDGILESGIDDLLESFDPALRIGPADVDTVLKRVQHFDPVGVAARNLAECLTLQLEARDASTPWRDEAIAIVSNHLALLGAKDFTALKRKTRLGEPELASIIALIQSLNPPARCGPRYRARRIRDSRCGRA